MERASFWWVVAPVTPNESKVMAVWRNGRKRRTARGSDSTVLAKVFDLRETLEHAHTVALDIKDIMDHGENKWGYGSKECLLKLLRNKCSFFDRSIFLVFRTSLFSSYSSTRAVVLPILQHHDKVSSRRILSAFDTLKFRTAEGVLYDYLACK